MSETPEQISTPIEPTSGPVSNLLKEKGLSHEMLQPDHLGVEIIGVSPNTLLEVISTLKQDGFDYLQCQGGYDEGPGKRIVCFYHLVAMNELTKDLISSEKQQSKIREVRIKVFLAREDSPKVPSLYKLFRGADWQERETFDMFGVQFEGHPHPKRLLMPEDWQGWPLRKDYVQPDFYEMQDAY